MTSENLIARFDMKNLVKRGNAFHLRRRVPNRTSGMEIKFNATGARKIGGRKGDVLYRVVPALQAILDRRRGCEVGA